MKSVISKRVIAAGLGAGLALMAGCAGMGGTQNLPPEEAVAIRAQAWADALVAGDLKTAYSYTSPSYRQYSDMGRYHSRVGGTVRWEKAEVKTVECGDQSCEATIILEYPARGMNVQVRRPRTYTWVKSEGNWWLYVSPK